MKLSKKEKRELQKFLIILSIAVILIIIGYINPDLRVKIDNFFGIGESGAITQTMAQNVTSVDLKEIPEYEKTPYVYINNNKPDFTEKDYTKEPFEKYSDLDNFGRCGIAYANICKEIMPKAGEKRGAIGNIKPSGWKNAKYEGLVDGDYLYNRCHLIGWQLAGENDNKLNLITGSRYMNVEGMLPFENMVDDYFEEDINRNNHVLYRVTPIYEGTNLVASGVQIEAYSIEDNGKGVQFNVYVYNVQPGIEINYATGESKLK